MADEFEELYGVGDDDALYGPAVSPSQSKDAHVRSPSPERAPSQTPPLAPPAASSSSALQSTTQQQQMPTTSQYSAKESGMTVTPVEAPQDFSEPLGSSGLSALFIHDLSWVRILHFCHFLKSVYLNLFHIYSGPETKTYGRSARTQESRIFRSKTSPLTNTK